MATKLLTEWAKHVGRWSRGHTSRVRQGTQDMLTRKHVSTQTTLTREYKKTQDMLVREHAMHVAMWARKHRRHVTTWAPKHARHDAKWARKHAWYVSTFLARRARNLEDSPPECVCRFKTWFEVKISLLEPLALECVVEVVLDISLSI